MARIEPGFCHLDLADVFLRPHLPSGLELYGQQGELDPRNVQRLHPTDQSHGAHQSLELDGRGVQNGTGRTLAGMEGVGIWKMDVS